MNIIQNMELVKLKYFNICKIMASGQLVNPRHLLGVGLKLAKQACKIVKDSYMNKSVKQYLKGVDDPVTQADFKIQSMLIKGLKIHYPKLRIVGEEQKQYEGIVETDYDKISLPNLPQAIAFPAQYNMKQSCIWIDPIDNTKGFIQGEPEAVTTLIGLSYRNKAQLGIISIPFKKSKERVYYNPSILFGSVMGGFAFEYFPRDQRWIPMRNDKTLREKARIVMSPFRENILQNQIAETIKGQKILAGGAGYKMALVAKSQAEMMAYTLSYTQKWDTCAGDAIIKAIKGYCTNTKGEGLVYNPDNPKQFNKDGVICSLNQDLLKISLKICGEYRKANL